MSTFWITEKEDVPSANSFAFDDRPSARPLIQTKKRRGPKMNARGTPALTTVHEETCSFKKTLCFLSFKKPHKTQSSLPEMPICYSLKIMSLYQTLTNAFEISRKTPLTSNPSSKDLHVSGLKYILIIND